MAFKVGDKVKYIGASDYFLSQGDEVTVWRKFKRDTLGVGIEETWYEVKFENYIRHVQEKNLDYPPSHTQVTREPWDVLREAASILSDTDSYCTIKVLEHIARSMENENKVKKHKEALEAANKAFDKALEDLYDTEAVYAGAERLRGTVLILQRAMKAKKDLEASNPVG